VPIACAAVIGTEHRLPRSRRQRSWPIRTDNGNSAPRQRGHQRAGVARMAAHINIRLGDSAACKFGLTCRTATRLYSSSRLVSQISPAASPGPRPFVDRFDANPNLYIPRAIDFISTWPRSMAGNCPMCSPEPARFPASSAFHHRLAVPAGGTSASPHALNAVAAACELSKIKATGTTPSCWTDRNGPTVPAFSITRLRLVRKWGNDHRAASDLAAIAAIDPSGARGAGCRLVGDGALAGALKTNKLDGRGKSRFPGQCERLRGAWPGVGQGRADTILVLPGPRFSMAFDPVPDIQATEKPAHGCGSICCASGSAAISLPNFGYWKWRLAAHGRSMPRTQHWILPGGRRPTSIFAPWADFGFYAGMRRHIVEALPINNNGTRSG